MSLRKRKSGLTNDTKVSENAPKKSRVKSTETSEEEELAVEIPHTEPSAAPDSYIDLAAAITYWSNTPATVRGVLGGYPQVNRVDLQGSANFLAKLRLRSRVYSPNQGKLKRAVDCGAGIGRVTKGLLTKVAEVVDIVEPIKGFTDQIKDDPCVGDIYSVGLEQWSPDTDNLGPYEVIWNQWCVGQLADTQLVAYLRRLPAVLSEGGWIIVKENLSRSTQDKDIYDDTDNTVTRTDKKFRSIFAQAGLKIVATELQQGMPKFLYPVRAYALQPN